MYINSWSIVLSPEIPVLTCLFVYFRFPLSICLSLTSYSVGSGIQGYVNLVCKIITMPVCYSVPKELSNLSGLIYDSPLQVSFFIGPEKVDDKNQLLYKIVKIPPL